MTNAPPLRPLPVEEWTDQARQVLPRYLRRPELYLPEGPEARPMPHALGLFAHRVELGAAWMEFANLLASDSARLDVHHRELAILRVAWVTRSEYEWKQHVRIASDAGITTEQLYAVPEGSEATLWTEPERAVMEAADQILGEYGIRPVTWSVLARHFDGPQLLELTLVVGSYACFAAVTNSVGLAPDPQFEVVDAPALPTGEGP